jgi:flagellar biosynthesis/type III secretory pathway protein FliH
LFSSLLSGARRAPILLIPFQKLRREEAEEKLRNAEQVLQRADRQAEDIERQASEKGYAEGNLKGVVEGEKRTKKLSRFWQVADIIPPASISAAEWSTLSMGCM